VPLTGVFFGAVFVGLATANDPAFGVMALLLAVLAISVAAERYSAHVIVLAYFAGFAIAASVPFVRALSSGEGVHGFLIHALSTPYPTLGDGAPHFGYLPRLTLEFSWLTLLAALGGLVLLIGRGPTRQTLGWAFVFLTMGPFLPSLTNQTKDTAVITDPRATEAMVLISVCLFAAWGLSAFTGLTVSKEPKGGRRIAILTLCGLALAGHQWWSLPPATDGSADRLAQAVLTDCPQGAILVTGGARIYSLISTVQAVRGIRPDVTVLPADALDSPRLRRRVAEAGLTNVTLKPTFPPSDALERWSRERPQAVETLTAFQRRYPGLHGDLQELAIWELVRDNFLTRPISFAGVSAPWLSARVQRNGVVLVFPRTGDISRDSLDYIVQHINEDRAGSPDSELHRAMVDLLLPLSDAARRQGALIQAALSADLARRIAGSDSGPLLASARAAARAGDREQTIAFVEDYLWSQPKPEFNWNLTETIQDELTRNSLVESYEASFGGNVPQGVDIPSREELVASLWALDELEVLARGYRRNRDIYIAQRDVDALCDGAAVYAQLGDLAAAREELGEAVSLNAIRVWRQLQSDSRFNLLRIETAPENAAIEG
jgi:tetratricopeptide (TPR) repeat protein